jgi:hypothetical protein
LPVYVWLELSQFVRSYTKFTSYSDRLLVVALPHAMRKHRYFGYF